MKNKILLNRTKRLNLPKVKELADVAYEFGDWQLQMTEI